MAPAPLRTKLGCWLLLGCWSAGLAEVLSGSSPFVFATPWGVLVTLPLYLLHAVFLAGVVHRVSGRLEFGSLYLAGGLFGLYEAFVTKVIWAPTWDPVPVRVAGIYPVETALLVLFWHPLLAFVVPVLVVESTATRSRLAYAGLPDRVRSTLSRHPRRTVGAALVAGATVQGALSADPLTTFGGNLVAVLVLAVGAVAWRRRVGASTYSLPELLPDRGQLAVLAVLLAGLYVGLGALLRPEFLPGPAAQATVWGLYLVVGGLLVLRLRRDRLDVDSAVVPGAPVPGRPFGTAAAAFLVLALVASVVVRPVAPDVLVVLLVSAVAIGAVVFGGVARSVVAPRANP